MTRFDPMIRESGTANFVSNHLTQNQTECGTLGSISGTGRIFRKIRPEILNAADVSAGNSGRASKPVRGCLWRVRRDNEHRIATAQSSIHTASGCGREGANPLKTPEKGLIKIEKKTVKHTLRMTEAESKKLQRRAEKAGISQAEFVRQKVFGLEPVPMPDNAFWNHIEDLYAIHDRMKDESIKSDLRRLILEIQSEATLPREVQSDGNNEAVAH